MPEEACQVDKRVDEHIDWWYALPIAQADWRQVRQFPKQKRHDPSLASKQVSWTRHDTKDHEKGDLAHQKAGDKDDRRIAVPSAMGSM